MRKAGKLFFGIGGIFLICTSSPAVPADRSANQYNTISKRNLFGLKEAPEPVITPPPTVQLPKVYLTGITRVSGRLLAFLKREPFAKSPGPAMEQSLMLGPGQKEGDIE